MPWYLWDTLDDMQLPRGCQLVGIELTDDAVELLQVLDELRQLLGLQRVGQRGVVHLQRRHVAAEAALYLRAERRTIDAKRRRVGKHAHALGPVDHQRVARRVGHIGHCGREVAVDLLRQADCALQIGREEAQHPVAARLARRWW